MRSSLNTLLSEALQSIIWKLERNEMDGDDCIPARIDRRDVVIRQAVDVLRHQAAVKRSHEGR